MVVVTRHGQTDWNKKLLIQGRTDIPLNDEGRAQALEVKKLLNNRKFDLVFSSSLSRAVESAKIISDSDDIKIDDRLIEMNSGIFEGKTVHEKSLVQHQESFNPKDYGVETYEEVRERVFSFLDDISSEYKDKDILIVSHGGTIRLIRTWFEGEPDSLENLKPVPTNCAVFTYEKFEKGTAK